LWRALFGGMVIAVFRVDIESVSGIETEAAMQVPEHSAQGYAEVNGECRALTVCDSAPLQRANGTPRRSATFLTQLLAVKEGLPQTRERRREEPEVAAHVYEAHMAPLPEQSGKVVSRAM
jgi:hypothetical protein